MPAVTINYEAKIASFLKAANKLKNYKHVLVDASRIAKTELFQTWIICVETPEHIVDDIEAIVNKDSYTHILESGVTPGRYDWSSDVYHRDQCWVKFMISANRPK